MKKIKSFTLLELIVSMVIGTILVTFLWGGYLFVSRNYLRWMESNQRVSDSVAFEQLLRDDFKKSYAIVAVQKDRFKLLRKSGNIEYRLLLDVVVREGEEQVDTINCEVIDYQFEYLDREKGLGTFINRVDLSVLFGEERLDLTFLKDYDAKYRYNNEL